MTLSDTEVAERLKQLKGWTRKGNAIEKQYVFGSFPDAIAFVTRLAFDAEAADHHPDVMLNYRRVTLSYSTHSEGGITEKDFAGAANAEQLTGG